MGEKRGIEKGIEQGMQRKSKEIALVMLEEGIEINLISKVTGLSIEEIQRLKKSAPNDGSSF
jgi:predicted transposase/invertase (TIGR01784 family)